MTTTPPRNNSWSGRHRRFPASVRRAALAAAPICQACGLHPSAEVDHIIPVAEGGTNDIANAQGLCQGCHDQKTKAERRRGQLRRRQRLAPTTDPHPGLRR